MRADMAKVIVERPRRKGYGYRAVPKKYRKRVRRQMERDGGTPVREGIRKPYGYDTKEFNEHLGPLRRYLGKQVGRPWDTVYAEICERINRNNVVQKHILTHLSDYVITNVLLLDGVPCFGDHSWRRYGTPLSDALQWGRPFLLYVCPKSGLLKRVPVPRRR